MNYTYYIGIGVRLFLIVLGFLASAFLALSVIAIVLSIVKGICGCINDEGDK